MDIEEAIETLNIHGFGGFRNWQKTQDKIEVEISPIVIVPKPDSRRRFLRSLGYREAISIARVLSSAKIASPF